MAQVWRRTWGVTRFLAMDGRWPAALAAWTARMYSKPERVIAWAAVIGAEDEGLHQLLRKKVDVLVRLPMHGVADSLNVSAAAAVLFYEARRQRTALAG